MRNSFAAALHDLAVENDRVVLLSGDIGNRLFDKTKAVAGDRVINAGIAEQNMMGVAAGMALSGFRPIVYTITPFTTYRCFEQIRVDVCYHEAPVVIVGTGSGLSYASLGPTHHSMEDVALLRTLPGMTVFCPACPLEVEAGLRAAVNHDGPVYVRLGKKGEPNMHDRRPDIVLGRAITMRPGTDICLVASGPVLALAQEAAGQLADAGISARVENFHTIKPLDIARLTELADQFRALVVIEEHGRIGGLYGAIAEWLAARRGHRPVLVGIASEDRFLHKIGSHDYARADFGISVPAIVEQATSALTR